MESVLFSNDKKPDICNPALRVPHGVLGGSNGDHQGLVAPDTPGPQVDASRYLGAMNTLFGKTECLGKCFVLVISDQQRTTRAR